MNSSQQLALALVLAVATGAGCAANRASLVLSPVGPTVSSPGVTGPNGRLLVFSAHDSNAHFNSLPYEDFYTDYTLLAPDGTRRTVQNNPNPSVPGPTPVILPAGEYRVIARANGYDTVTVPVVITPHHTTTVHLDSGGAWPPGTKWAGANPVRLPDGEIVGCAAIPVGASLSK